MPVPRQISVAFFIVSLVSLVSRGRAGLQAAKIMQAETVAMIHGHTVLTHERKHPWLWHATD